MNKISSPRIFALLIDCFFTSLFAGLILSFMPVMPLVGESDILGTSWSYRLNLIFPFYLLYFFVFDLAFKGATLGKQIMGYPPPAIGLGNRLLRSFLKVLGIFLLPVTLLIYLVKGVILHDLVVEQRPSGTR